MSLKTNTVWNLVGSVSPMILGLVTIPYLIKEIHLEAFGILTLVWSLIGYFSLFDFGIGRALTHQVSSHLSISLQFKLPSLIKTGLLLMFLTGILGAIVLMATSYQLGTRWLNVSVGMEGHAVTCLVIAALGIPLTTITAGLKGILEGYEDFRVVNILKIILGILNFGLPALTVMLFSHSLEYLVISLVITRFIILIAHLYFVNKKNSLESIFQSHFSSRRETKDLLTFGVWMTLSNIISPLMVTADRFIISYILGASIVAVYTVPFDFIVRLLVIPAALTGVLFPRFTHLFESGTSQVYTLYKKSFKSVLIVMSFISLSILLGSFQGLSFWIGKDFAEKSWLIMSIFSIGLLFNSLAQIPYAVIQAAGDVRVTSIIHLCEFILYVPSLYFALFYYGLNGAATIWVFRVFTDLLTLTYFAKRRML